MEKSYYLYILTNYTNKVLYIGVTNNLSRRIYEHKNGFVDGFSKKYNLKKLVYVEEFDNPRSAVQREKTLKHWVRAWKINQIEKTNPTWRDLSEEIL